MTPTTRTFCPLCDWHHDSADAEPTTPVPGMSVEEHVFQSLTAHYAGLEAIVREHLETHPLIEWATALNEARRERAEVAASLEVAMGEWGKSGRAHAKESVAMAAERGQWNTTRMRVWSAAQVDLGIPGTGWQSGFRACSERVLAALDEPVDTVIYDFNAPLRGYAAQASDRSRCPHCQMPHDLDGWPAEICRRMRENGRVDDSTGEQR